jgi:hypothetical protein
MGNGTKDFLGVLLIICGIVFGAYIGVFVCFVGGIVDVIEQIRAADLSAIAVAVGIAKVMFAGFAGFASGGIIALLGLAILKS